MKRLLPVLLLVAACAEGRPGPLLGDGDPWSPGERDLPDAETDDERAPSGPLLVNEIAAAGDDFFELLNVGDVALALGGYRVTDRATDGGPEIDDAVPLPDDAVLKPGGRLVVVCGVRDPHRGLRTGGDCPGPGPCIEVGFGLSQGNGDTAFVLDPDDRVVAEGEYPPSSAPEGAAWCRLPDGSGPFARCRATPGAPNRAER